MKEQTDRNNEQTDRKSEQTDRKSEQTDRRKKLQGVLKDLPVVFGIYFLLVAGLTVLRPFYLKSLNRDITLTIVATGEKQESSKSNYVRLSHIAVNGRDINLAQVKIDEGSLWTYDSLNDYLRVYEFEDPQSITVQLKDVHSLKVGMVSEVGSGIAEILIDGETGSDTIRVCLSFPRDICGCRSLRFFSFHFPVFCGAGSTKFRRRSAAHAHGLCYALF